MCRRKSKMHHLALISSLPPLVPAPSDLGVSLRSGFLRIEDRPYSLNGVQLGSVPIARRPLGLCVILGWVPSFWFPVATMLGFQVQSASVPPGPFRDGMQALYPDVYFFRGHQRKLGNSSLVFSDLVSLPPPTHRYWEMALCPHLVYHPRASTLGECPVGWRRFSRLFQHSEVGGATDAQWVVTLVLRQELCPLAPCFPELHHRPWATIAHSLDCRVWSRPAPIAPSGDLTPCKSVVRLPDGSVGAWGLLPTAQPATLVTFSSDRVDSGWCRRRLTPRELAAAWDCPILVQDRFKALGLEASLDMFVTSAPAKILALAADYFLSYGVRGGVWSLGRLQRACAPTRQAGASTGPLHSHCHRAI